MGSTQTPQANTQEKKSGGFLKNLPTDPLIFTTAMGFIVLFVAVTVVLGDTARDAYSAASEWVTSNLGWLFIGGVSVSFIFLIGLFCSCPATDAFSLAMTTKSPNTPSLSGSACSSLVVLAPC